ncbi:hypothetical protein ACLESO_30725, partial [Pyxidicoccus sp. 3LG]
MSRRVHPAFRKLLGLAAAPGRTLSALEPDARARTVLEADPGGVEDRTQERLAPLMAPASVASRLERTLAKLSPGAEGEAVASRGTVTRADGLARERVSEGRTLELPFPSPPFAARGTRRSPRPAGSASPPREKARQVDGELTRRVEQERLLEMAGLPGTEEPASRPAEAREAPGRRDALRGARSPGAPPLPSREEVRARFEQRARNAGAEVALETPV